MLVEKQHEALTLVERFVVLVKLLQMQVVPLLLKAEMGTKGQLLPGFDTVEQP